MVDLSSVRRALEPLNNRIRLAICRAVLRIANDATGLQTVQVEALKGDLRDDAIRMQDYGFTSHPLPGSECVALSVGGVTSHTVVIRCDDRRYRIKGTDRGEVGIYDDQGQVVFLKRNEIVISSHAKVHVSAPDVAVDADNVSVSADSVSVDSSSVQVNSSSIRLDAADIQLHATATLKLDCGGQGFTWSPGSVKTWQQGVSFVSVGPPQPPEHP